MKSNENVIRLTREIDDANLDMDDDDLEIDDDDDNFEMSESYKKPSWKRVHLSSIPYFAAATIIYIISIKYNAWIDFLDVIRYSLFFGSFIQLDYIMLLVCVKRRVSAVEVIQTLLVFSSSLLSFLA